MRGRNCIKFFDATVSFSEGLFELLDGAAMGGFSIAQFDLQLVNTTAHRFQLFDLGAKAFSGREPFIELGDLVTEDADFFLQDFTSLLGRLAGLLRTTEFICVGGGADIKCPNPLISLREKLFKLLNSAAMGGFPITQFNFQQMDTILCRFQLLHTDSNLITVCQSRIELGNMFAKDTNLFLQDITSLLGPAELVRLGGDD